MSSHQGASAKLLKKAAKESEAALEVMGARLKGETPRLVGRGALIQGSVLRVRQFRSDRCQLFLLFDLRGDGLDGGEDRALVPLQLFVDLDHISDVREANNVLPRPLPFVVGLAGRCQGYPKLRQCPFERLCFRIPDEALSLVNSLGVFGE